MTRDVASTAVTVRVAPDPLKTIHRLPFRMFLIRLD